MKPSEWNPDWAPSWLYWERRSVVRNVAIFVLGLIVGVLL